MRNLYKNHKWIEFREEVIEHDGGACVQCLRTKYDGVVLQVHHREYIKGRFPWEYGLSSCETLCRGCHAALHGKIMPKHGWDFIDQEDLGGLYGNCELCNNEIRHAFHISHPDWEPMVVGTNCCDNLTGTKEASQIRKFSDRLQRFYKSSRWKEKDGNYLITQKQIEIKIYEITDGFKIKMGRIYGTHIYSSIEKAKERIFQFIDSGKADKFFMYKSKKS